jgi:DUF971 family protein
VAAYPTDIVADRAAGTLTIGWDDGHASEYDAADLRWACPCAICAGEAGVPGRLATLSSLPPDELSLADVQTVGAYAIMPVWASGHASGIYSFEYLRSLCRCGNCVSR